MLDVVSDWCTTWKLSINVNKTKVMHFRPQSFVYSLLYTLYVILPAILTLVIKLPNAQLAALASSFAFY
jgi:hypothetical protein